MNKPKGYPWQSWFGYGVTMFRLSPEEFWALSVQEWRWLLSLLELDHEEALKHTGLEALMKKYPDIEHGK